MQRLPDLRYEEYECAAAHLLARIESLERAGCPAIDQLILKWYLIKVLKVPQSNKSQLLAQHVKYFGAIQKMLADGLVNVASSIKVGNVKFRCLIPHPSLSPAAHLVSVRLKNNEQSHSCN